MSAISHQPVLDKRVYPLVSGSRPPCVYYFEESMAQRCLAYMAESEQLSKTDATSFLAEAVFVRGSGADGIPLLQRALATAQTRRGAACVSRQLGLGQQHPSQIRF
jgi:hypothetical protein